MSLRLVSALLVLALTSSCRKADFLTYAAPKVDLKFDVKTLVGSSEVDILWVIDNSGSMEQHQVSVMQNTRVFMDIFVKAGMKWKMGLISTDTSERPYVGFPNGRALDWTTADPVGVFIDAVSNLGLEGDPYEKMFDPVQVALVNYPAFSRPGVTLAMISVTDAPEQSDISVPDFLAFLKKTKGDLSQVITYGVLGPQDFGCPRTDDYWLYAGSRFEKAIVGTRGKVWKLCSDFGVNLTELAKDLVTRVTIPKIYLDGRPRIETLRVLYRDQDVKGGPKESGGYWVYDYDLNAILFWNLDFAPGDQESVRVVYIPQD